MYPRALDRVARWGLALLIVKLSLLVSTVSAQIELPASDPHERIVITADSGNRWQQGAYEVWLLRGNCLISQGLTYTRSQDAVLWIEQGTAAGDHPNKIIAYLEGGVTVDYQQGGDGVVKSPGALTARMTDKTYLGRFASVAPVTMRVPNVGAEPLTKPDVWNRAVAAREPGAAPAVIQRTQFAEPERISGSQPPPLGARRIRAFPRSDVRVQAQWFPNPANNEWIAVITSGVNLIVDGIEGFGSIDVKTDRLVIWTSGLQEPDLSGQSAQAQDVPLEIYMEGNIEFRQGDRVVYAQRMYYDVRRQTGTILGAEIIGPVPNFGGVVRLRADVIQQIQRDNFIAQNASVTSSRLGIPTYEFTSGTLAFQDVQTPVINPLTGQPEVDPLTGEPLVAHQRLATSRNNTAYLEEVPVFYWPTISTDLSKPNYYINRLILKNDQVFGTQVLLDFDAYQLFGVNNPIPGTDWDVSLDYLSKRGWAGGTTFSYDRTGFFDMPGRYFGVFDIWGLHDNGLDNLGRTRRSLIPEKENRGRIFWRDRHYLPDNFQFTGEIGLISDRNFLEEYFEEEWDELKDQTTGFELKRLMDNHSLNLSADLRVNSFFTTTEGGRIDHYLLGASPFEDTTTFFSHSQAGYLHLGILTTPKDPADAANWGRLPWEINSQGERLATRNEIDLPFDLGPFKIVPYALGEAAHWGEVLDGQPDDRLYGQVGVRASIPFWAANPYIQNELLNVNGLAHKVVFDADIGYTDASRNVDDFPLYDPVDDDNIEDFRRRFAFQDFGAIPPVPAPFDERFYGVRYGLMNNVTSPATEIADDMFAARLGLQQRWQTKRGGPLNQRIVDWITLDTNAVIFPDPNRDNFGEELGLVDYSFAWHVGDRLTMVSSGYFEFYNEGPRYVTVGGFLNRPPRGSLYLGFRSLEGPMESNIIVAAYNYRMSPKWASTFGTTFDVSGNGNIGQNFTLIRIGESFNISLGLNVDASKGNFGVNFGIEPRFFSSTRTARNTGLYIPPAGEFGLE